MNFDQRPEERVTSPENKTIHNALNEVLKLSSLSPEEIKNLQIPVTDIPYIADQLEYFAGNIRRSL